MLRTGRVTTTEPVQRIVVCFSKDGPARFMGHLDLMRNFQRAARRAGIPLAYSQGFNPHPRMTIASPLPVGASGDRELAAFDLTEQWPPHRAVDGFNRSLPSGVQVVKAWSVSPEKGTFGSRMESYWAVGILLPEVVVSDIRDAVFSILEAKSLPVLRRETKTVDIRPGIVSLAIESDEGREAVLQMHLVQEGDFVVRPAELIQLLQDRVGTIQTVWMRRVMLVPEKFFESLATPDTGERAAITNQDAAQASPPLDCSGRIDSGKKGGE